MKCAHVIVKCGPTRSGRNLHPDKSRSWSNGRTFSIDSRRGSAWFIAWKGGSDCQKSSPVLSRPSMTVYRTIGFWLIQREQWMAWSGSADAPAAEWPWFYGYGLRVSCTTSFSIFFFHIYPTYLYLTILDLDSKGFREGFTQTLIRLKKINCMESLDTSDKI